MLPSFCENFLDEGGLTNQSYNDRKACSDKLKEDGRWTGFVRATHATEVNHHSRRFSYWLHVRHGPLVWPWQMTHRVKWRNHLDFIVRCFAVTGTCAGQIKMCSGKKKQKNINYPSVYVFFISALKMLTAIYCTQESMWCKLKWPLSLA